MIIRARKSPLIPLAQILLVFGIVFYEVVPWLISLAVGLLLGSYLEITLHEEGED